jgi:hypothetical protein
MRKQDFTLFWAIPPTASDWSNLMASGCERVMLTYQLARTKPDVLSRLSGLGRRVVVRIEDGNQDAPVDIAHALSDIRHIVPIDAVIVGVEPDTGCDMRMGSPSWCQQKAYASLPHTGALIEAIQGLGLPAVSPSLSYPPDCISEDGVPMPGRTTYREIVAPTWQRADGCGVHLYCLGWSSVVDRLRFKFGLKWAAETWHKNLWIDEVGVILGSNMAQMAAYIEMAEIIMHHPVNPRVMLFCPFISAGAANGQWDERFILRDPACYQLLGNWMRG